MAITGSQPWYAAARAGIERAGASRAGGYVYRPTITIGNADGSGTIDGTAFVIRASLRVTQAINDTPASAYFTLKPNLSGARPAISVGQIVTIAGEFGGQVLRITRRYEHGVGERVPGQPVPFVDVECIDYSRLLNRRLVTAHYGGQSASTIAALILQTYTSGFSGAGIAPNLPTVDDFPVTNETVTGALMRLAKLIDGDFYVDGDRVVHLFGQAGDTSPKGGTPPAPLTLPMQGLRAYTSVVDGAQLRTRMVVEGQNTTVAIGTPGGAVTVSVDNSGPVDYLVQGGGGSGGTGAYSGGGGAGGLALGTDTIKSGTYPVVVGAGGAASSFNAHTAAPGLPGAVAASGGAGGASGSGIAGGAGLTTGTIAADYVVVSGGGGGGTGPYSGGGGGGGVTAGSVVLGTGQSFPVTVGAGGAPGAAGGASGFDVYSLGGGQPGVSTPGGAGGASGSGPTGAGGAGLATATVGYYAVVVAGGGGGGSGTGPFGAGGGGGGVVPLTGSLGAGSYPIVVGAGGTGGAPGVGVAAATNGGNSSAFGSTAIGGGRGGQSAPPGDPTRAGGSGGSGGGGADNQPGGSGTAGQGNAGATNTGTLSGAGGGGGAGAPGAAVSGDLGGNGGDGVAWGGVGTYGGGGGGNGAQGFGQGGAGGGGRGGAGGNPAADGAPNTGGGGGGGTTAAGVGGHGGSGVVIILYTAGSIYATGGSITSFGAYTMHTFTSSGTFTVTDPRAGGGGGGWSAGGAARLSVGGTGGDGVYSQNFGGTYGGGGAGHGDASWGTPGAGGGGSVAAGGAANTGGGGGALGGPGGSGVVVIRYPSNTAYATGGTISYAGGYTIHTFTASGTFTIPSTATGGGGGGSGGAGVAGSIAAGGSGGPGTTSAISGAGVTYGGGGGGWNDLAWGAGGSGGGGGVNTPGTPNTGGGGGANGAAGGSGIVILSYASGALTATGGTITFVGARTIHTFTANGSFVVSQITLTAPPPLVYDLPIADAAQLNPAGGLVRIGFSTYPYTGVGGAPIAASGTNPPGSNVTSAAVPTASTLAVDDARVFATAPGWVKVGDQIVRYTGSSNAAPGVLSGFPAAGFGALMAAVTAGTTVTWLQHVKLSGVTIAPPVNAGDSVTQVVVVDDAAAQAATAAVEGGDGVHEQGVQDGRLSVSGMTARANSELTDFDHPLLSATWATSDRNAKAGRLQVITIDGVSITLMITSVDVTFEVPHVDPRRTCTGSTVRTAALLDALVTDTN
jgi:hypothetical protein